MTILPSLCNCSDSHLHSGSLNGLAGRMAGIREEPFYFRPAVPSDNAGQAHTKSNHESFARFTGRDMSEGKWLKEIPRAIQGLCALNIHVYRKSGQKPPSKSASLKNRDTLALTQFRRSQRHVVATFPQVANER